jgi:hypothetical protein
MSYLNFPRLAFAGAFQADVSTVNNDPRHFDNATFEPYFQDFQHQSQFNGWWNPIGTGIFRLSDCKVTTLLGPDGKMADDLALACSVGNSPDRPSGKLVDIDPDWQLASCIYGFTVTLADANGNIVLQGDYEPNPFRDLWFTRAPKNVPGDTRASAMFQSVLTNLQWNLEAIYSPFLQALKASAKNGLLSIRLTTYGYCGDKDDAQFSYGKVVGAIGPAFDDEPRSFILGRRFMPAGAASGGTSANGITCFSSAIDPATDTLQADLSNALPIDAEFNIIDLGSVDCVVLKNTQTAQGEKVTPDDYVKLGSLDFSQSAQNVGSGIQAFPLSAAAKQLLNDHPLALVQPDSSGNEAVVCMTEAANGLEVRPEQFVFRLDPNDPAANQVTSTMYAARYGKRLPNPQITLAMNPPTADDQDGDCPASVPVETTPQAPMPTNNIPTLAIQMAIAQELGRGQEGKCTVTLKGPQTMGTPRSYMDGQLYTIAYNFSGPEQAVQQQFDCYAVLVFSTFAAPAQPTWDDVQPILQQYANLYPVMSKGLFDFSQQEIADANADILYFVFNNDNVDDPDYMPVTRDMSSSKRKMLVDYFDAVRKTKRSGDSQHRYAARCPMGFGRKPG